MKGERERAGESATLTDAQKATVKSILSKYTPSSITAADARAIHSAFRDAGLRGGPSLNEAVKSAGFDPDKLRDLDPPPDRKGRGEGGPEDSDQGRKGAGPDKKRDK